MGDERVRLALFQPDIPQNAGALIRLCACLGVGLDVVEPCGFALDDRSLRRVGMDYVSRADLRRLENFEALRDGARRIVLMTTESETSYLDVAYRADDVILAGRESAGVPRAVHDACDLRVTVPMADGARSLNVAAASAMVLGEALRQTRRDATTDGTHVRRDR